MEPLHAIATPQGPSLAVMDLFGAAAACGDYDVVISLVDLGMVVDWSHPRHHRFWVEDLDTPGAGGPDGDFLDALLGLDLTGAATVLIHCHGGYSRSPAAAMLWAHKLGASLEAIENGIDWNRADPNRLILALGEARLGSGRSLQALAERKAEG